MGSDRGSMDPLSALVFVKAWAQVVGIDATCLQTIAQAGFLGDLGPAEVEYDPERGTLIVRGGLTPGVGKVADSADLDAVKQGLEAQGGYRSLPTPTRANVSFCEEISGTPASAPTDSYGRSERLRRRPGNCGKIWSHPFSASCNVGGQWQKMRST